MHFEDHESIFQTILALEPVFNAILVEIIEIYNPYFFLAFCYRNLQKTEMQEKKQKNTFFSFSCQRTLKPVFYTKITSKFYKWPLKSQFFLLETCQNFVSQTNLEKMARIQPKLQYISKGAHFFFYLTPGINFF